MNVLVAFPIVRQCPDQSHLWEQGFAPAYSLNRYMLSWQGRLGCGSRRSALHTASTLGKQRVKRKGDQTIKFQGPSLPTSFYQSFTSERSLNSPREDHQQGTSTLANVDSSHVNHNDCAGRWQTSSDSQAVCSPP